VIATSRTHRLRRPDHDEVRRARREGDIPSRRRAKSYWPVDEHPVTIHDVRPIRDQLSFDRNGFVVVDEPT
jgi:hypothetical protein